jgi:outer membrane protein assembly factor BamB
MNLATLTLAAVCLAADWPRLFGPEGSSASSEDGLIASFSDKGPPIAWQRDVGEGYASLSIRGGKAALFHRVGGEEVLELLDAATGKALWKASYRTAYRDALGKGDGPRATPVLTKDAVITLGAAGVLSCHSLADGKRLWSVNLLEMYEVPRSYFGVGSSPLVDGKLVLVNVGGDGSGVVAFSLATGKEAWRSTSQPASYASPVLAEVAGERQAVFFTRTGLLTLNPETGKEKLSLRWRPRIDASVNAASPLILPGGHIFLSTSYGTGAILLKAGKDGVETVWKNDTSLTCHFSTPAAVGDQLYGCHGRQEEGAKLRCIDWKDGKVRWSEDGFGCGSVLHADGKLWLMSEGGELILAKPTPARFDVISRARALTGPVRASLSLSDGLLFCRDDRKLVAWKVKK